MSTESSTLSTIRSPEYLHGTASTPPPNTRFAVAIPQEVAANFSKATGTMLTTLPGKATVSSLSGLGWATFGTIHQLMWISRLIFTGGKSEKVVNEVARNVDQVAELELRAKETLRDNTLDMVNGAASIIPGGFLVRGVTSTVSTIDAGSKQVERWSLLGMRSLVTTIFGLAKFIIGGTWFRAGERKVEQLKKRCYQKMLHPSPLGEHLLLWGDQRHASALKMLSSSKARRQISPCTEEDFLRFTQLSVDAKRIILDKIIASTTWSLNAEEAYAFRSVLERWILKEKEGTEQSEDDKKVILNLIAISNTLPKPQPLHPTTAEELDSFFKIPAQEQEEILFLLTLQGKDSSVIPGYVHALQKKKEDLTNDEKFFLRARIGRYYQNLLSLKQEYIMPSEFENFPFALQYRIFKLVGRECLLSHNEQKLFLEKAPNRSSWRDASPEDKKCIAHIALYYFNSLSRDKQKCIYDISFGELKKLPREQLSTYIFDALEKFPLPSFSEQMSQSLNKLINPDEVQEREQEDRFIISCFEEGIEKLLTDQDELRRFIHIANKRIPFEKKVLLRDALDVPVAIYFFSKEELETHINVYKSRAHDLSLPEQERVTSLKILKILHRARTWHNAEIAERDENLSPLELKEGETLPLKKPGLPDTPLDKINQKIGSQVVTSGSIFKTLDFMGLILEKSLTLSSLGIGQVPRAAGYLLDTTPGSTAVYGSIRTLALGLQISSQFQVLMNYLARSLSITIQGKEYTWLDNVERPAAALPLIPLKLSIPLQNSMIGGMESIKARFDSWNANIAALQTSKKNLEEKGHPEVIHEAISTTSQQKATDIGKIKITAAASSDPAMKQISSLPDEKLKEIFSSSEDIQEATLKLRNAVAPAAFSSSGAEEHLSPAPLPAKGGVFLSNFQPLVETPFTGIRGGTRIDAISSSPQKKVPFIPVMDSQGRTPAEPRPELPDYQAAIESNPALSHLTQNIFQRTAQLSSLYQNLQIAQEAQKTLMQASSLQTMFANYGGEHLSSLYNNTIGPSLGYALDLWKTESEYASFIVNTIATIETLETNAAYKLYAGIEKAGDLSKDPSKNAVTWLSEHIADYLVAGKSDMEKGEARKKFDAALGYIASLGSHTLVTYYLRGLFGFYTPVILLPYLLSRTLPDLLNASAEPIARNLGKKIQSVGYHGLAWAGKTGGICTHNGMTAIGKFVQAAINKHQGYVDKARVQAFRTLERRDQEYVYELIKESTQITPEMKNELIEIGKSFFENSTSLDEMRKQAFFEALLIAYDHLQPQDFLKITPAYFSHLDKRVQRRIKHLVRTKFPLSPITKTEDIIAKFNTLSREVRKGINKVTREEFFALPPDRQYEFCFQVLHSAAFKNWYSDQYFDDPSFETLWSYINPQNPSMPMNTLDVLLALYQDVGDGELFTISPEKLATTNRSRLIRLYEMLEKSHPEQLAIIADAIGGEAQSIQTILETEHPLDPGLFEKRTQLLAALASIYRSLPEYSQRQLHDISLLQISYMTHEEKKIYLECIIKNQPAQKQTVEPLLIDVELKEKGHAETFMNLFNAMNEEDKIAAHETADLHKKTFSYLTRSLIEELKGIDTRLKKAALEKKEAETAIVSCTNLLTAIKETGGSFEGKKRINVLSLQLREAGLMKRIKEKELSSLQAARKEIEALLNEEKIGIPPSPIEEEKKTNPLIQTIGDLLMNALRAPLLASSTLRELEERYATASKDFTSLIENMRAAPSLDSQEKEFLSLLQTQKSTLQSAYEEQKHRLEGKPLNLPPPLEIIVRGSKERLMQVTDLLTLNKSHDEASLLVEEIAKMFPDISPTHRNLAHREIDSFYKTRTTELSPSAKTPKTRSSWQRVATLLPLISRGGMRVK